MGHEREIRATDDAQEWGLFYVMVTKVWVLAIFFMTFRSRKKGCPAGSCSEEFPVYHTPPAVREGPGERRETQTCAFTEGGTAPQEREHLLILAPR